ncbi:MAG: hypothetical protein FD165_2602 [Gammaproteobacteria bacterium]|nr:MAG: hypothetical protein FD165_2602 [Gammaproteobacteria bacterium]TND01493.1 MAG: hypothetical protein FD120_2563 [Gammaproteobacteria bacterium]
MHLRGRQCRPRRINRRFGQPAVLVNAQSGSALSSAISIMMLALFAPVRCVMQRVGLRGLEYRRCRDGEQTMPAVAKFTGGATA